jgi:hypothetical protein
LWRYFWGSPKKTSPIIFGDGFFGHPRKIFPRIFWGRIFWGSPKNPFPIFVAQLFLFSRGVPKVSRGVTNGQTSHILLSRAIRKLLVGERFLGDPQRIFPAILLEKDFLGIPKKSFPEIFWERIFSGSPKMLGKYSNYIKVIGVCTDNKVVTYMHCLILRTSFLLESQ